MKINKIEIQNHFAFGNHTIIFDEGETNMVFLVGNNGSGKTLLLMIIYDMLADPNHAGFFGEGGGSLKAWLTISESEKTDYALSSINLIYTITQKENNSTVNIFDTRGIELPSILFISKVMWSLPEVTFTGSAITNVTTQTIDSASSPRDRSDNIGNEFSQLLIDISEQDKEERYKWFLENDGKGLKMPDDIGSRLKRFTNVFDRILHKSKKFEEIRVSGQRDIIFRDVITNKTISLGGLSSGERQIIFRMGYLLRNLGKSRGATILIDEPELSLHPTLQIQFKTYLNEIFHDYKVQFIIATHSPFIFEKLQEGDICVKVDRSKSISQPVELTLPGLDYKPSVSLISYLAYDVVDEIVHIELYTLLQEREGIEKIKEMENWFRGKGGQPVKQQFLKDGKVWEETIMTWLRNKIHHKDEKARPDYTREDLIESINKMLNLLKHPC